MWSLTEKPVDKIKIAGIVTPINLSFNRVIDFYRLCDPDHISLKRMLTGFYVLCPDIEDQNISAETLVDGLLFLTKYINYAPYGNHDGVDLVGKPIHENSKKYFDYEQDTMAIYSAFKMYAGIDLWDEIDRLHWQKFQSIFMSLPDECLLKRIISIRQHVPTNEESKDSKLIASLTQQKQYYKLKTSQERREEAVEKLLSSI